MDIGPPRRIIEIEPDALPLPDLVPDEAPTPPLPVEPVPLEPQPAAPEPAEADA